ncbi:hypothetical protein BATDEDRAFT_23480 [Batrachochytrium dendrobatidis JAM81]|uniref:GST C-terminal domain-containing protein n=2 Tax=Batrachochytrium dendrobatidis TaxID=109871 RepID=F4NZ57_BATDJ|nr:uncharacterized protein BATDEDRAFT_23480 [Batrachochytrium dendrobatidis JAM81]EGF81828.1 hypothetical protein BATDEDRAFT_23480 [Batrachochytrium dendrobatidis JAM81]KAK5670902.1 hypothetical protein QVD99_002672 [Batrachochytrium dendrobatidis]OAJ40422.1 hypothetical protein BDEG_24161 [Batrachochytrium dendrobatidis JEL423]|eukprot:XP_006677294.1 hypothetical protein BATDEDRAFT_23480 [Batrachochytrium dendrobatidis JAM81]
MPEYELFAWSAGLDLPTFDPFCLSIAAYLNLVGADWSIHECNTPGISPNGELPVLRAGVELVAGTYSIISTLQSKGLDMNSQLSPKDKAESQAFISLIESRLYDALLYTWWIESENYKKSTHPTLFENLSFFGRYSIPSQLKEKTKIRLQGYRMICIDGEMVPEIYVVARESYRALSIKLGDKKYFYGDSPSTLDAIAYGHLALHAYPSLAVPKLFSILTFEFPNLIAYCARFKQEVFATPLTPSLLVRPSLTNMIFNFVRDPEPYFCFYWNGFQNKMVSHDSKKLKEQRVQAFWKGASIVAAVGFFVGFVFANGIVQVSFQDSDQERSEDDESESNTTLDYDDIWE